MITETYPFKDLILSTGEVGRYLINVYSSYRPFESWMCHTSHFVRVGTFNWIFYHRWSSGGATPLYLRPLLCDWLLSLSFLNYKSELLWIFAERIILKVYLLSKGNKIGSCLSYLLGCNNGRIMCYIGIRIAVQSRWPRTNLHVEHKEDTPDLGIFSGFFFSLGIRLKFLLDPARFTRNLHIPSSFGKSHVKVKL